MNSTKKILIAHQSTIPHYRVKFYEAVKKYKPEWWDFTVIDDERQAKSKFFIAQKRNEFHFNVKQYKNYSLRLFGRNLSYQAFLLEAWKYDLLVIGNAFKNIAYPLSIIYKMFGKKILYWGHGKDVLTDNRDRIKDITDNMKLSLSRRADGFFAYTKGVCKYLSNNGVDEKKIHTLLNTIDIMFYRSKYYELIGDRENIRKKMGIGNKRVLLFVGRFSKSKRLKFLYKSFQKLTALNDRYYLILIGAGDKELVNKFSDSFSSDNFLYAGSVSDEEIHKFYIAADILSFPGAVGLGPLQALCYDLCPVVMESDIHSPEFEYHNEKNSIILPKGTSPEEYAAKIDELFTDGNLLKKVKASSWGSIEHLTIDNMAKNFIEGINSTLK